MPKCFVFVLLIATCCPAQQRFTDGELKGFTKSPTEHIIARIDEPIKVFSIRGKILPKGNPESLKEVVFEIRGPGSSQRIRATKSRGDGTFRMQSVPEGTYLFKATRDGFQSVVGTLVVSKKADRQATITIEMPFGV
jgi:hypothetical protein